MKNVIKILVVLVLSLTFVQAQELNGKIKVTQVKVESVKFEVEVDSAEEIESTFMVDDFKLILDETDEGEEVFFKIKCNGAEMSNGLKSSMSYEIKGNTNDKDGFLKSIEKIRNAAIKYYQNKN